MISFTCYIEGLDLVMRINTRCAAAIQLVLIVGSHFLTDVLWLLKCAHSLEKYIAHNDVVFVVAVVVAALTYHSAHSE